MEKEEREDAVNSLTDGPTANCDENDVAELATSSSQVAAQPINGLAVSSSDVTASRKRNNESAQNVVNNDSSDALNKEVVH